MTQQVMSTEDFLEHYGVKGMKWGVRRDRPDSDTIKDARARIQTKQAKYANQERKIKNARKEGKSTTAAEKRLADLKVDFLKDPDRVTASYLTKGEKAVIFVAGGPAGMAAVAANRGVTKVARDVVSKRQASGHYDKK